MKGYSTMQTPREVLTPDALALLQAVARSGSFAAAARELGVVPSAITYRIRQIEDALDVLLFDRKSRQARLTDAGAEMLREGGRLLLEIDAVAHRVKRVAAGWESQLTIAVDTIVSSSVVMEMAEAFFGLAPITRLRLREESLSGTLEALVSGQADLALGVALEPANSAGIQSRALGEIALVYAVAPHHPLAGVEGVLKDELVHRRDGRTAGGPGRAHGADHAREARCAVARPRRRVRARADGPPLRRKRAAGGQGSPAQWTHGTIELCVAQRRQHGSRAAMVAGAARKPHHPARAARAARQGVMRQ
jgi:DNA-binding transcriptional LysR family regulator